MSSPPCTADQPSEPPAETTVGGSPVRSDTGWSRRWSDDGSSIGARPTCASLAPPHRLTSVSGPPRSEEHTSELQSLMRLSYAVFCLTKKTKHRHSSPLLQ